MKRHHKYLHPSFKAKEPTMPKVELVDYTGAGNCDPYYAAAILIIAKSTRLEQNAATRRKIWSMPRDEIDRELAAVANSVRTSWEFVDYKFQINDVTRAFTHQLVRSRYGVSFAQQTQRLADMSTFETRLPTSVEAAGLGGAWQTTMAMIGNFYSRMQKEGVPNQDCRGVLPTNVLTNIFAKFDLRALADICGKRINLRAQDEYTEVAIQMRDLVYNIHPWAKMFIEPDRGYTPYLDTILKRLLGDRSPVDVPEISGALKEMDKMKGAWG